MKCNFALWACFFVSTMSFSLAAADFFDDEAFVEATRILKEEQADRPEPVKRDKTEDIVFFDAPPEENLEAKPSEDKADEKEQNEGWLSIMLNPGKASAFDKRVHQALAGKEKGERWPSDLPTLSQMAESTNVASRMRICGIVSGRARSEEVSKADRRKYVEFLSGFLSDASGSVVSRVLDRLFEWFQRDDFTETAVENVRNLFDKSKGRTVVLLMGRLDIDYAYENTKDMLINFEENDEDGLPPKPLWETSAWAPALVAARKGDKEAISRVLAATEERCAWMPERGWPTYKTRILFPYLTYVRQPETVEYFKKYLFSSELFVSDHDKPIPYGYPVFAARSLVRMLEGFPWPSNDFEATPSREDRGLWVAKWRDWMNAQKEWVFRAD